MGSQFCFWVGIFFFSSVFSRRVVSYQDGFLSLSCGGSESFIDPLNITWTPDSSYISTGNTTTINHMYGGSVTPSPSLPVRFFPDKRGRKCYHFPLSSVSSSILVRFQFVYKNYDGLEKPPVFFVSLGTAMASTVILRKSDPWIEEFIYPGLNSNGDDNKDGTFPICFHSVPQGGYPVISTIEVRLLPLGSYTSGMDGFSNGDKLLRKCFRINCGFINGSIRYPVDPYDRIWDADVDFNPSKTSSVGFSNHLNFNSSSLKELPPMGVLQTARTLTLDEKLTYNFPLDKIGDYYVVLYFGGIFPNMSFCSFNILINGDVVQSDYRVNSSATSALYFIQQRTNTMNITFQSERLYTQVNAIELYEIIDLPPPTSSTTVSALQVIHQYTGSNLEWEDDPCSPLPWDQIGCKGNRVTSLELSGVNLRKIIPTFGDLLDLQKLDLHNTSLEGELENLGSLSYLEHLNLSFNNLTSFGSDLDSLTRLHVLDLQNNSLQGTVPDSLGFLKELQLLNLKNNKLQGPLPQNLKRESLVIRTLGNVCLSFSISTCDRRPSNRSAGEPQLIIFGKKKQARHKKIAIIVSAVGGSISVIVMISALLFLYIKMTRTTKDSTDETIMMALEKRHWNSVARVFSFKEIKSATKNFKEIIGRGSFGSVHLGKLSDSGKLIAVKVRYDKTQLGLDSFINEVCLLSKIRHPNLVSLEGFCYEGKQQILVYEYLPGGSLADNLYGSNSKKYTLSWVRRLKIAVDAAKGLEFLHNESEPRIIHRDVKCSNILLDSQMNAKLCDFGLCKQVLGADATHVTTVVKGTAGYLDPEYYTTQQLTEKSDIYSFGVVLLELICGREPLTRTGNPDTVNLVLWAKPLLQAGVFEVVDEVIKRTFDVESMKKVASIASRCVERDASLRPTISEILRVLREAYSIQLAYLATTGRSN